jgi:hypothetical protein
MHDVASWRFAQGVSLPVQLAVKLHGETQLACEYRLHAWGVPRHIPLAVS